MFWRFDGSGEWEAFSSQGDPESPDMWRIQVCDDGTFDVNCSDSWLLNGKVKTWPSLSVAKEWCESGEMAIVARAGVKTT